MRSIEYRSRAVADLDGILVYTAMELRSPQGAERIANDILSMVERVAELPEMGRVLADDDLDRSYRRVLAKRYWIYYSYGQETLTVWRIFHTSRDTEAYGFDAFDD